ncbi:MAG: HAD-IC family P-type ATPase, partial [Eggerthellaceae bacterium]|nr:HAD-IC family P-type ATPase [Eggerthellaceae bacterium]
LGHTVTFVSCDGQSVGYIVLADTLRPESKKVISEIKAQGLVPVLITGDNPDTAASIASEVGIEKVYANCLPENKLNIIADMEKEGMLACMVGDGVNDAPALKRAYVSVAMGGVGSDIAVDAADIALVDDDISQLPYLTALGHHTIKLIRLNLTFAMTVNIIATILAMAGILGPVLGALVHNVGSVLVIFSSATLLTWNNKKAKKPITKPGGPAATLVKKKSCS